MPPANVYSVSQVSAYITSLFVGVLIAASVAQGGETKWLEAAQLLTVYVILALAFLFALAASVYFCLVAFLASHGLFCYYSLWGWTSGSSD